MRKPVGFGKADQLLSKVVVERGRLNRIDWAFLEQDAALLVGCLLELEGCELLGARYRDERGEVGIRHGEDEYVLQIVHTQAEPPLAAVGVVGDGERAGALLERAGEILSGPGVAFSVMTRDGLLTDYAMNEGHAWEKARLLAGDTTIEKPIPVSKHPNLAAALAFSHGLNKSTGVLFGGEPYSSIESFLAT